MKRITIAQSNCIPLRRCLDMIGRVGGFVSLDTMQFTRNDWRNRIPSAKGDVWLAIPCKIAGRFGRRTDETEVTDHRWGRKHYEPIRQGFARGNGSRGRGRA